jgi:tripartite-type tricarboxylate transporter receptor subunit TctC
MQETRMMKNGTAVHLATAMVAIALCASTARAQEAYPSKPIQMIVTTAAGGALDLVARTLAERLSESMKQPVIIENNPAGNGGVAAGQFARATPDGHTLMMVVDSTITINPHLYKNITYDPFRDFTPISVVTRLPLVLVVAAESKTDSLASMIARAKAEPGKMTYASTGLGTHLHIGMELFKLMTKTDILHIPYRATTGAMAADHRRSRRARLRGEFDVRHCRAGENAAGHRRAARSRGKESLDA